VANLEYQMWIVQPDCGIFALRQFILPGVGEGCRPAKNGGSARDRKTDLVQLVV
jgi:hypothetical protein